MKRFDNRTVIVTGGARGMGASFARGFAADGAKVVVADVLEQAGRRLAAELADHAIFSRLRWNSRATRSASTPSTLVASAPR
jgi:3alpha(or 20beta)-hydroxysteroid dehydrogenase